MVALWNGTISGTSSCGKEKIIPQVASIDETIRKSSTTVALSAVLATVKCCSPVRTRKSVSRKVIRYWLKD